MGNRRRRASGGYRTPEGGSVLVFLPGTVEIDEVSRAVVGMRASNGRVRREWVLPLHGALPPPSRPAALAAPEGVCKIVLATNVAETSITIPDVAMVIDSGQVKQTAYEPSRRMASLADVRVSAARRGSGRVARAVCATACASISIRLTRTSSRRRSPRYAASPLKG